jgi:hypothetical protein
VTAPRRLPELLEELRRLDLDLAAQSPEDGASDERGDEPAAAHPDGQAVGERGSGERHHLQPERVDEATREQQPDHTYRYESGRHAADAPIADPFEDELGRDSR